MVLRNDPGYQIQPEQHDGEPQRQHQELKEPLPPFLLVVPRGEQQEREEGDGRPVKVDEHSQSREEEEAERAYADQLQGPLETVLGPVYERNEDQPRPDRQKLLADVLVEMRGTDGAAAALQLILDGRELVRVLPRQVGQEQHQG